MSAEASAGDSLRGIAKGTAFLLVAGLVVRGLEAYFDEQPLMALAFSAFAVDFLAQRAGVTWSSEANPREPSYRKALRGLGMGLLIAAFVLALARLFGLARIGWGSPSLLVAMSATRPLLLAMRDELLFRGIPLAIAKGRFSDRLALPFAALLGTAPLLSLPGARLEGILLTLSSGLFFALLWRLGQGGFLAWGAHAGWLFVVDVASRGALLDVSFTEGSLAPMARASGWPAYWAAAIFAVGAGIFWNRQGAEDAKEGHGIGGREGTGIGRSTVRSRSSYE